MQGIKRKAVTFSQTQSVYFPLTIKVLNIISFATATIIICTEAESAKE
jgi:hypothetical protein